VQRFLHSRTGMPGCRAQQPITYMILHQSLVVDIQRPANILGGRQRPAAPALTLRMGALGMQVASASATQMAHSRSPDAEQ
jgi:hypothetical protein